MTFSVRALLLILLLTCCSGCSWFTEYVYVHERFPIITKPDKPKLTVMKEEQLEPLDEVTRKAVIDNILALRTYQARIDKAVDLYNEKAKEHNAKPKTEKETSP
jgi:hypothetical protein